MLTQAYLCELFEYRDGDLYWREQNQGHTRKLDVPAGTIRISNNTKYRFVKLDGKGYYAHVLIWCYETGHYPDYPSEQVDHKDHNGLNNSFDNLRLGDQSFNQGNQNKPTKRNRSGFMGVFPYKNSSNKIWASKICVNGKAIHLGCFATPEEAHEAYVTAKRKLHAGNTL